MLSLDHKGSAEVSSKPSRTLETSVGQFDLSHIRSNRPLATTSLPHSNRCYPPCWCTSVRVGDYSLCARMAKETAQKGFIPGYASTIADAECKQRYAEKLKLINGHDPYELPREEWKDNIDMWPAITYCACLHVLNPLSKSIH